MSGRLGDTMATRSPFCSPRARSALHWPDKAAVLYRGQALTYRQLEEQSNRLAHALQALGLQRGDRVAIVSPNRPDIVVAECAFY